MNDVKLLRKELEEMDRFVNHYALCSLLKCKVPYFSEEFKQELQIILDKKTKEITVDFIAKELKLPYMQAKNRMDGLIQKGLVAKHWVGDNYTLLIDDISDLQEPIITQNDE
jgi:predicted transcriptional regulator